MQDHEAIIRDHKDHEEIIMSKIHQNSSKSPIVFSDASYLGTRLWGSSTRGLEQSQALHILDVPGGRKY